VGAQPAVARRTHPGQFNSGCLATS
jgi:hypothetical protein